MAEDPRTPAMHTAMEIVKGALSAVLGFPLGRSTIGSKISEGDKGRITVQLASEEKPGPEAMLRVQEVINGIVEKDLSCHVFTMARAAADAAYGDAMYDKFEVPAEVTTLTLFYLEGLALHAAPHTYLPSTGGVGRIQITKERYMTAKRQLEVMFNVLPAAGASTTLPPPPPCPTCEPPPPEAVEPLRTSVPRLLEEENGTGGEQGGAPAAVAGGSGGGQVVTPWEVEADEEVDYNKLVVAFGSQLISEDMVARVERLTNRRAHRFLRRGLFFSHRDLNQLLDLYEKGEKFYLYTGRGPSSEALHLGHLVPFQFTQWLQEAFGVPLVIQLTDDEKFLFKSNLPLAETHRLARENARDIIACEFDPAKTFMFSDLDYIKELYPVVLQIQKFVTFNQTRGIFGFNDSTNIGCIAFPAVQAAPSFSVAFPKVLGKANMPCLIPCAIDQDAYFRMTRDVAPRLRYPKPALIHSKFFPGLQGPKGKMSASELGTAVFVTDTQKQVEQKVKSSFSGGQDTKEKQLELGANLSVDVAYQYLGFFLEDDDEYRQIGEDYAAGRLLTGQVKKRLVEVLWEVVGKHQRLRAAVTDEQLERFMSVRPLEY
ncbi:tryptophan--tRNA ligase [Tribonema minus]|uniref:Tryptophan--tRNA ligase, cytoplasmic n=1 Tax=Tribonema minus TaxID=303371 RepID=A0A835ZE99_9STRA|nr:tryptophan--tRNA ligase [Tribonema minus]